MKHHDPKHASDDAFEDLPTGTWRAIRAAPAPEPESESKDAEIDAEPIFELAN